MNTNAIVSEKMAADPSSLHIVSAGLVNGKWGIVLSNGMELDGVQEIIQTKPSYSDGYSVVIKVFIPVKSAPITKSIIPA
jgi:hypothetical protein